MQHGAAESASALAEVASWEAPLAWGDVVAPLPLITSWVLSGMELLGLTVDGARGADV